MQGSFKKCHKQIPNQPNKPTKKNQTKKKANKNPQTHTPKKLQTKTEKNNKPGAIIRALFI